MPYIINRFSGAQLVQVDDGTLDQTTDLRLVGKNYAGYGEAQNENYLWLLESFSNTVAPPKPVSGQVWYDTSVRKLKFYDDANLKWRTTGGAEISDTAPAGLTTGDFWFDTLTNQLFAYTGSNYVLIGPQAAPGQQTTLLESDTVKDMLGVSHAIVKAFVNGIVVFIISSDAQFTLDPAVNPITGFSIIYPGMTLVNSSTGSTSDSHRYVGTATDTDKLGGILASQYVQKSGDQATFTGGVVFKDPGFTVGDNNDIKIFIDTGHLGTIENTQSSVLAFKVTYQGGLLNPLNISGYDVIPGTTLTYNLGTQDYKWATVWAGVGHFGSIVVDTPITTDISGKAANADKLLFARSSPTANQYVSATDLTVSNSIVARDNSGSFSANIVTATATKAEYADLAEKYEADDNYSPGTVVIFGGNSEITTTDIPSDTRIAGVISTNPAYLMNSESTGLPVALRGKVPVKVVGYVKKGDVLVSSSISGYAQAAEDPRTVPAASMIGKSLENKTDESPGIVMVVVN